jgi:PAS domain S-box-containing protein
VSLLMAQPTTDELCARLAAVVEAIDAALITTDLEGLITSWNGAAERLFGYSTAETVGTSIAQVFPANRLDEMQDVLDRVGHGETLQFETVRAHRDGAQLPVSLTVAPILGANGEPTGTLQIARDLSSRQRAERAAGWLSAIVESSDDAILSKDLNGIVTSWNKAAERMFGYTAPEIIGKSIRTLIPADRQAEEDVVLASIRRGQKVDHFETIRKRKDGSLVPISLTVSPIVDPHGRVIGASKIARDISDRVRLEAAKAHLLIEAEENAAVTEKLNHVGTIVASALDRDSVVQAVIDAATEVTTAQFGAFFYNVTDERGESSMLYAISGAPREAFSKAPTPRSTEVFAPIFDYERVVRSDDITKDSRYARTTPHGLPAGEFPVHSYLAVPVRNRSGDVAGALFFGHAQVGRFAERHERLAVGVASWAAIALENASLYVGVQEAGRLKDEFLATLSHELRTPLNAILGYARMIRAGIVAPERHQKAVETIERNATSLTQIVEDVLDVSRIISGKMRLNVQPVNVPDVVRSAVEAVLPAADAKGVRIDMILDPAAGPISGDPERLHQVVWNLMSNAVKFTSRHGRVHVRVERVDSHVEVVVSDTGVGIPRNFVPHIFERFRQADAGTTRERGGLGLGLSITRQLVEMHGGTIDATSAGEGKGATFRVRLPLMIVQTDLLSERIRPTVPLNERDVNVPDLRGVSVLAVDDDPDAVTMVREILEAAGAQVWTAGSAPQALDVLRAVRPDVLVADLGMPQMDGFALIREIRRHSDPVVSQLAAAALTAYARSEDRTKALRSGFQIHLSKPIDPGELMAAIAALARRTGVNRAG